MRLPIIWREKSDSKWIFYPFGGSRHAPHLTLKISLPVFILTLPALGKVKNSSYIYELYLYMLKTPTQGGIQ